MGRVPAGDGGAFDAAAARDGCIGGERPQEQVPPRRQAFGRGGIDHHDIGPGGVGGRDGRRPEQLAGAVGPQRFLQEQVAVADQCDPSRARRRQHRVHRVVRAQRVAAGDAGGEHARGVVPERQHHPSLHARGQRQLLLMEQGVFERNLELDGARGIIEVRDRDVELVVHLGRGVPAKRELGDAGIG